MCIILFPLPTLIFIRPMDLLSLNIMKIKLGLTGFLQQGQVSCLYKTQTKSGLQQELLCLFNQ